MKRVSLGPNHVETGATRHFQDGRRLPKPASLAIGCFESSTGFYLFYIDSQGKDQSDTYHDSLEQALSQSLWEFGIRPEDWRDVEEAIPFQASPDSVARNERFLSSLRKRLADRGSE